MKSEKRIEQKEKAAKATFLFGGEQDPPGIQCAKRYTVPFFDNSASLCELAQLCRIGSNPLYYRYPKQKGTPLGVPFSLAESKGFEPSKPL